MESFLDKIDKKPSPDEIEEPEEDEKQRVVEKTSEIV